MKKKEFEAPTWGFLRRKVARDELVGYMDTVPEEWKKGIALAAAVAKWDPARGKRRGHGSCGLCVLYTLGQSYKDRCLGCPLFERVKLRCTTRHSPFDLWDTARYSEEWALTKLCADNMYRILLELYIEEYNR